jgi:hypothetical protein
MIKRRVLRPPTDRWGDRVKGHSFVIRALAVMAIFEGAFVDPGALTKRSARYRPVWRALSFRSVVTLSPSRSAEL